jgi:predicted lactoylglutathione lyase
MKRQLFVNLPIKDLNRSMEFFGKLGFTFNMQFTDEKATCMIISDEIFAMLLTEPFFKSFTKKEIPDTSNSSQVILALSVDSREAVDQLVHKAVDAGATTPMEDHDHGFMYQRGFADPDGHLWEVFWMDPAVANQQQPETAAAVA